MIIIKTIKLYMGALTYAVKVGVDTWTAYFCT